MAEVFSHPLARAARVWRGESHDGSEQRVLVVVTTLELDPNSKHYKAKLVDKLTRAANEHIAQSSEAGSFIIMNPLRQWRGG
jgi:hypothetical protein